MNINQPISEFIDAPNTLEFIVPNTEYFLQFIQDKPYIIATTELTGDLLLAYVDQAYTDELFDELGSFFQFAQSTVLGLLGERELAAAGILEVQEQPFLRLRGQGVLVGIIDTGIDYTSDVFRYEDGTSKIAAIYDQTTRGQVPYGLSVGIEYSQEQINQALASDDPLSIVPVTDPVGHGTFLASVAAGRDTEDFIGAAPDAELLVVKLKPAREYYRRKFLVPPEQENAYSSATVMLGIDYAVRKAQDLGRPVAICLGLGTNFGSHGGLSVFEQYIATISRLPAVALTLAVGNEVNARHHYLGTIEDMQQPHRVELRVGDDAGDIYLSIWSSAADRIAVSITSPAGEVVERVPAVDLGSLERRLILEPATVIVEYYFPTLGKGAQNTVIKILNATPGIWTITLYGEIILEGTFHIWLPIRGFVSPNVEFLLPNPYYTVVIPATTFQALTTGGYNDIQNSLYEQSSWGPNALELQVPDLVAPAVEVVGVYPLIGLGTMTGTSVAAAITTGAAALALEWGIVRGNYLSMCTCQIRAYLIRGAIRMPGVEYPNPQTGYGQLNLFNAFNLLR